MNRKLIIGIFCLSCIVFGTGALMTVFIDNVSCDEGYTLKDKKCYKYDCVPYLSSSCKDGYVFNPGLNEGICVKYQKYSIFDKYDVCGYSNDDSVDVDSLGLDDDIAGAFRLSSIGENSLDDKGVPVRNETVTDFGRYNKLSAEQKTAYERLREAGVLSITCHV